MTVRSKAATTGEKELKTEWPIETGLIFGTTKRTEDSGILEAQEENLVPEKERVLL